MAGSGAVIRKEAVGDHEVIAALTTRAFEGHRYSSGTEAEIISRLRAAGALRLSLVAEEGGRLVGHVAFSPSNHEGWLALGPVAVEPGDQKRGIGSALIETGLVALAGAGSHGCILVGDPGYYSRFGFVPCPALCPEGLPGEYFMVKSFGEPLPPAAFSFHRAFFGA